LPTWTPRAVGSEIAHASLDVWRAVEAQHVASTRRLTDSLAQQHLLERLLDAAKPPPPAAVAELHYLLATPFRYPPFGHGSRFRAPTDPGVFYGAARLRTACAEVGWWRWRFLRDSPGLDTLGPVPQTVFRVAIAGGAIDLRRGPFVRDAATWTDPDAYGPTQAFAAVARTAGVQVIRYASVRDAPDGECAAVLAPEAFVPPREPRDAQTWFLTVDRRRVTWQRDGDGFEFDHGAAASG
jgi:hypothetical protein